MRILVVCLLLLLLPALALAAAGIDVADIDVTGKWTGSFDISGPGGEAKTSTALLILKQNGVEITGSAGPTEDEQYAIQKGRIEGHQVTLDITENEGHVIHFVLVVAGDRIFGQAHMSADGESRSAKLDVTRAK